MFDLKLRNAGDYLAATRLIELKKENGSNPWPVIESCIEIWSSRNPTKWRSFLVSVKETRKSRKNEFASTKDKTTGGILRWTVDIPEPILLMIRCIYSPQELQMDKEFFLKFSKKFPHLRIAEKI